MTKGEAPGIDDLEPQEAIAILRRLAKKRGAIGEAVREEVHAAIVQFDGDTVAAEVYSDLDMLAVEDLWDRSGLTRDGYVDPTDEAWAMIEDILKPHLERIGNLQAWGMPKKALEYCLAVLDGIDRYDRESSSEFKRNAPDDAAEAFGWVMYEWKRLQSEIGTIDRFDQTVAKRFPERV